MEAGRRNLPRLWEQGLDGIFGKYIPFFWDNNPKIDIRQERLIKFWYNIPKIALGF